MHRPQGQSLALQELVIQGNVHAPKLGTQQGGREAGGGEGAGDEGTQMPLFSPGRRFRMERENAREDPGTWEMGGKPGTQAARCD